MSEANEINEIGSGSGARPAREALDHPPAPFYLSHPVQARPRALRVSLGALAECRSTRGFPGASAGGVPLVVGKGHLLTCGL